MEKTNRKSRYKSILLIQNLRTKQYQKININKKSINQVNEYNRRVDRFKKKRIN